MFAAPSADFNDITTGSTQYETAGAGYDLATGLGSPKANLLIPYLTGYGSSGTTTTGTTAPAAPATLTATALSSSSISLTWSASANATGYEVYELQNGQSVLVGTYAAGTSSATISGLTAGTTYSFRVAAYDSAGANSTGWTQVTTPAAAVTAAQNFQATATSSTTAALSSSAVNGATGYQIYQWNGSAAVLIKTLAAGTTSAGISGLTAGSTQYFYVTAYNATSSASTGWDTVVMPAAATLSAPVVTATATSTTTGKIAWTPSAGATGYQLYYWNGYQAVELAAFGSNVMSASITGFSAGSTNYFYVLAYNSSQSAASAWAGLTTPSAAAAVTAADLAFTQTSPIGQHHTWWM